MVKQVAILMNLNRLYDRQIIRGIAKYVQTHTRWQVYVEEDPAHKLPLLSAWKGDGVIIDFDDFRLFRACKHIQLPIVGVGRVAEPYSLKAGVATVRADDDLIGQWAAEHLVELGLKHYAYCGIPRRGPEPWVQARHLAFERRLNQLGFECAKFGGRQYAARNWSKMLSELSRWLKKLPKPIGIMACNDSRARHVSSASLACGYKIPDDVAIVGVDNDELMCELALPPLSSIALSTERMGFEAARLLDQILKRRIPSPVEVIVPPLQLIPRRSTDNTSLADPLVSRATAFIRERASKRIGVEQVARHVNVSRSTLDARFKSLLKKTAHEELQTVRLRMAKHLLLTTDLPIAQIAARSGFSSEAYMNHVFRRELGKTPGKFRRHD